MNKARRAYNTANTAYTLRLRLVLWNIASYGRNVGYAENAILSEN